MKPPTEKYKREHPVEPPDAHPPPAHTRQSAWSSRPVLAGFILLLAILVAYQPLWRAGYIWDDDVLVTANPCVVGPLGLKEIWTTRAADICPLTITTFWAEHKLWGLAPLPYHLVNVLMHAACAILLWRVLLCLQVPGAWLGAALWALHPVQVESVAWITEMKNTQSGIFYLLAILFFLRARNSRHLPNGSDRDGPDAPTILCAALAMASKSSTVVLPVVLCLLAWWVDGRWLWRRVLALWPIFLLSMAAGVLSIWTQILQPATVAGSHLARSWPQRLATSGDAFWFYLGKLAWPHPLMPVYPRWEIDTRAWFAFLPLLAAIIVLWALWRQRRAWGSGLFLAGGYFLVAIFPVLGWVEISFFRYSFVADHFVYLASMGPLALAGAGMVRLADHFLPSLRWQLPGAALLLLALGLASWQRTRAYRSEETLWTDALAKNPHCWVAHGNLGVAFAEQGRFAAAIDQYHDALKTGATDAKTYNNLASVFFRRGQLDHALSEYRNALKISPRNVEAYYSLGNIFLQEGQVDQAISQFQSALKIDDHFVAAHSNLGAAFKLKGQLDEAIAQYEEALRIDPRNIQNLNNLGNAYLQKGQAEKATNEYVAALQINSNDPYTYRNIGNMLSQRGRLDDAIVQYREALKIDPADAESHNNLGNAYLQKGQLTDATSQYEQAVRIDPGYAAAHCNLGLALARNGQLDEAIRQLEAAIRLKPDYTEARHDLATVQALAAQAHGAN